MSSIVKAQDTRACKDTIVGSQYRTCVIADMETHVPVRDVIIHTDNGHWARSDYRGYWNMRYTFDSASVKREGYLETKIYSRNLPDTLRSPTGPCRIGNLAIAEFRNICSA